MFELCSKHYYIDNENIEENEEENRAIFQELILRNIEKVPIFKSTPSQDSDDFILDEILKFSDSHSEEELNSPSIKDLHAPPDSTSDHSYEKDSMPKGEEIENEFDRKNSQRSSAKSLLREHCSSRQGKCRCQPQILNEKDSSGKNALHYCSGNQNINSIDQILSADPSLITQKDDEGYTPLHLAVISGNKAIVKYLLSKGADVDAVDDELHSSVHWATVCGEVDCLEILIQEGAKTATTDIYGAYPVHYSAQICGKSSDAGADLRRGLIVLKRLIKFGVDVNVKDRDGRQPLMWAASSGSSDAILCLVNAGANVYETDKDGLTPLHCTASRGHRDCVEALVGLCGADVSIQDYNGCTPLFYSVTLGHLDCTRLLLDYGSDPNVQDKKGRTSAHCGAAKGQLETLKLLNKSNGNLWLKNIRGDYPFHDAIGSGRKELIRWLLNQKPEAIDCCNNEGRGALHIAAMNNNVEVCKILIDNYADINIIMRNSKGDLLTPLDAAHTKGNKGCAKYIKLHGGLSSTKLANKDTLHKALTLGLAKEKETTLSPEDLVPDRHRPESTTLECTADDYLQPIYKQPKGHDQTLIDNDQDQIYEFSKDDDLPDHLIHPAYDYNSENDHNELSSPSVIESLLTHVDEDHIVENATSPREKATTQRADSVTLDVKESGSESPITVLQLPISSNKSSIPLPEMNPIHTQTENLYENVTKETQTTFFDDNQNDEENTSKTDSGENDDNFGEEEGGKRLELPEKENNATKEEENNDYEASEKNNESNNDNIIPEEHDPSKEEDALRNTSGSREGTQRYDEPCEEEDKSVSLRDGDRASSIIDEISDDSTRINLPTMDDSGIGGERSQDEDSHLDSNSFLKKKEFRKSSLLRTPRRLKPTGKLLMTMLEDYDRDTNHSEYYSEDEKVEDPLIGQSSSSSIHGGDFRPSTVHGRSDVHSDSETRNRGAFHLHRRPVRESYRYQNKLRSYQIKPRKGSAISITQAVQMSLRKYKMERRIFQDLLELKRLQIRAGRANEHVLVKRLSDNYNKSIQDLGGLKKHDGPFTFKEFEKYLYGQLRSTQYGRPSSLPFLYSKFGDTDSNQAGRSIQNPRPNHHLRRIQESHAKLIPKVCKTRDDIERLYRTLRAHGIDSSSLRHSFESCSLGSPNVHPADCTHLSHRCHHAAHAYSGIPCFRKSKQKSIILPKIDDGHTHSLLASTRIRKYDPNEPLTIELTHGTQKQCVKLPTDSLEKSTKYYVTLTVDPKRTKKVVNL